MSKQIVAVVIAFLFGQVASVPRAAELDRSGSYVEQIARDNPVAHWRLDEARGNQVGSANADPAFVGTLVGSAKIGSPGPRSPEFPSFASENRALSLVGGNTFVRVADSGTESPLDFQLGDSITIEAWVRPDSLREEQQVYIVGKGRTNNTGFPRENQNYALRLRGMDGTARASFLFRRAASPSAPEAFHRWNSDEGFVLDGGWHHVAVVYTFGQPQDARAYIDGQESGGSWDMGGPTKESPVVDDDELWIGSSLGGNPASTFQGQIDEVAIYRKALDAETLKGRFQAVRPDPKEAEFAAAANLPADTVVVELFENLDGRSPWTLLQSPADFRYEQQSFAWIGFPKKYTSTGVIDDRSNPFLLRARMRWNVSAQQAGPLRLLLRSKNAARVYLDGKLVAQTSSLNHNASGHEAVPELATAQDTDLRPLPPGCQEQLAIIDLQEGEHILRLDAMVGGKGLRLELDELCVAVAEADKPFRLLSTESTAPVPLTEEDWAEHRDELRQFLFARDRHTRDEASRTWQEYWERRHELARDAIESQPAPAVPALPEGMPANNEIDRFIGAKLASEGLQPSLLTDDYAFLRRVTLDTVGVVPAPVEIAAFVGDKSEDRRAQAIERLLEDPRWADHWVSYWQDVLAENPGILKPQLNNTGPFRWWIYESFFDNKPLDQFVTELVLMQGSKYYGGPAGFGMATQNDAPMAAKAHVLAKAFLAMDMTCARCHDAPYHPFKQRELFSLAAMLKREPITLPKTSTVPLAEGARKPLVEITLRPGVEIAPQWPFALLEGQAKTAPLLRDENDPREQFASALITSDKHRFAKVMVNRLWRRYLGRGLIEPVDDWESGESASHPELLEWLARQFVLSGYNVKHVARLILNSHAYQREVAASESPPGSFASPTRRRLSAEQLIDSLFAASGKQLNSESLTLDPEGRRPVDTFLNLGDPRRAWQFTSLSNERDRPALALPMAQSIIDLLLAYGWRDSRPNPLTVREESPTMLQPLTLANGIAGARAARLSEDHAITRLSLDAKSPGALIEAVFLRILSRPPDDEERAVFAAMIEDGFDQRVQEAAPVRSIQARRRTAVSWSNHLSAEATKIKLELERQALAGDPSTTRLASDWRERLEDVVWALLNSPEFVFVP